MGLIESFLSEHHLPCYCNRSVWGSNSASETDFVRDIDGHGWHLDRARFDLWLRRIATERGAFLRTRARVESVNEDVSGLGWLVSLAEASGELRKVHARVLIDASGRFATLARRLGARCESAEPRMVCSWLCGVASHETPDTVGFTFLEAVEEGWWYTAPLPQGRRALAFHTDADLVPASTMRSAHSILRRAESTSALTSVLRQCGFSCNGSEVSQLVASGGALNPPAGSRWFAAGDAALHFDPLSSQGLLNALFTGLASAEAASRLLEGADPIRVGDTYLQLIGGIRRAYLSYRLVVSSGTALAVGTLLGPSPLVIKSLGLRVRSKAVPRYPRLQCYFHCAYSAKAI